MNLKMYLSALLLIAVAATIPTTADAQPVKKHMGAPAATLTFPQGKNVVEIPFEFERDKIIIPVSVAGSEPLPFILDTGAPIAVLMDEDLASTLDLKITGKARVGGAGEGETKEVPIASDVTFDVAGIGITGAMMAIGIGKDHFSNMRFAGVIGRPIFKNLVVDFDFENQILRLYPPDKFSYSGSGEELPITIEHGSFPYINTEVSIDGGDPIETSLVIDTGAGHALSLSVEEHDGLEIPEKTVSSILGWGANGVIRGRKGRISSLKIGDYLLQDVITSFPDQGGMHALKQNGPHGQITRHGILGAKVLKRFRVVFDYTNERVIFEPNGSLHDPFRSNTIGLMPKPWGAGAESMEVAFVIDSSPAQLAGIEVGDHITAINGTPVAEMEVNDIIGLIEQDPGSEMTLTVRRGNDKYQKKLTLKELI